MTTLLQNWRLIRPAPRRDTRKPTVEQARRAAPSPVEIAPNDPILMYFASAPGAVEIESLHFESPALAAMKAAGVRMAIPLISQGELVGLLNMGQRLSEQDYSADDRRLLTDLATQAAPALRVAQLVREQQAEVRTRERLEQELRVARLIQQTLLPKEVPQLPGWTVAAYYQPARAVGGDFYDFLELDGGRLGLVIGDVTDKGVPAALVMATTRSLLRTAAFSERSPGQVLERANNLLCPDIPPKMFVTCLYAVLDPATGHLRYANAGHDLPYQRHADGRVSELRARGMPLGLMADMRYEEHETRLAPGESILLYSDGIVEAHNPHRDMFGFPRLSALVQEHADGTSLIDYLLAQLAAFTGPDWEQEDDVTMVTFEHAAQDANGGARPLSDPPAGESADGESADGESADGESADGESADGESADGESADGESADGESADGESADGESADGESAPEPSLDETPRLLGEVTVASEPGNERTAMQRVVELVQSLPLTPQQIEHLKTAVGEATMNAMEHGNHYAPDKPVLIQVFASSTTLSVRIRDHGGGRPIPTPVAPDLEAKLAELQSPRGWGLFLIKNLVDEMRVTADETHHTVELILKLKGGEHGGENT